MASCKYDGLDPRTQLEQAISIDLKESFEKRGCSVVHNGTATSHAPAGKPDIVVSDAKRIIIVEVTASRGAAQDREFNSISDHLREIKKANGRKSCYCIFISPSTAPRMLESIRDYNRQRISEKKQDQGILPLSFDNIQLLLKKMAESESDLYKIEQVIQLWSRPLDYVDDLRIRKLLFEILFPFDKPLAESIHREEIERDTKTLEQLVRDLTRLEDYMRQNGVATAQDAIDTLIYLVFLKLYEEKRERDQKGNNRLRSVEMYQAYLKDGVGTEDRKLKRGIHKLFETVKQEGTFIKSQMFTENTALRDEVTDDFIMERILPVFSKYNFLGTGIDALGAVYEVLAQRASKDVKVGQFFTPENVVKFMVQLAELDPGDKVLDPACGTGRFLIYSMHDMVAKVDLSSHIKRKEDEKEAIRKKRLIGSDIDNRIAKIARMNMWINGDGKSNIFDGNGLLLQSRKIDDSDTFDDQFDAVLTNPPLGELNYQNMPFSLKKDAFKKNMEILKRMPFLPSTDLRDVEVKKYKDRVEQHSAALQSLKMECLEMERLVLDDKELEQSPESRIVLAKKKLKQTDLKTYDMCLNKIKRKQQTVDENIDKLTEAEADLKKGQPLWDINGNTLKGGALFLAAIWNYLKGNASPDAVPEWRGGKMLIVLDEGILNTDTYSEVRNYLKKHFYIKAIISLTRDTFVPISKTTTKTTIVYGVKKVDESAVQKEPVFFAHAEHVGLDTKGNASDNDLEGILQRYRRFKKAVVEAYEGKEFIASRIDKAIFNYEVL